MDTSKYFTTYFYEANGFDCFYPVYNQTKQFASLKCSRFQEKHMDQVGTPLTRSKAFDYANVKAGVLFCKICQSENKKHFIMRMEDQYNIFAILSLVKA